MSAIPKKTIDRLVSSVGKFQKILQVAKDRDLNESDTVSILNDMLNEIFGYDKYLEVTSELMIRGTYCDLAIKIEDKFQFLIEAKAVGIDLKDNHIKQAIDYGANKGIPWVVLTNGIEWRLYRIRFEQPINYDVVASFNYLTLSPKSEKDQELLFLLCKEGLAKNAREDYHEMIQSVNRYVIGNLLLTEDILGCVRKELRKISDGIRVDEAEIARIIKYEVIKREVLEGDEAARALQKIAKAQKKLSKKTSTLSPATPDSPAPIPTEPALSVSEQILKDIESGK